METGPLHVGEADRRGFKSHRSYPSHLKSWGNHVYTPGTSICSLSKQLWKKL